MPHIIPSCGALVFAACIGLFPSLVSSIQPRSSVNGSLCASNNRDVIKNGTEIWPYQRYQSSNATPPYMQINATGEPLAPGLIFFGQENEASVAAVKQASPFIMTDDNELVWSGPIVNAANFRPQTLYNQSILTYWEGTGGAAEAGLASLGYGQVLLYDNTYQLIQTICLKLNLTQPDGVYAECEADTHESFITSHNSILVTAYNVTQADATSVGGPADAWVYDPLAVEVDIKTGDILFLWSPLAHVPINGTHYAIADFGLNASKPYDWFHMNSIQMHEGNYLINARNMFTTYYVSPEGDILWQIDGVNGGSFGSLPESGTFSWEHEARIRTISANKSLVTWFANDNGVETTSNPSKALALLLTLPPNPEHPPEVVSAMWDHVNPVAAYTQGAVTQLDNGNYLVGYGAQPIIKEFGPGNATGGDLRWSAQFGAPIQAQSYRTYKQDWHATPATKPSLVVLAGSSSVDDLTSCAGETYALRGYVSWNGATDVSSYVVYVGSSNSTLVEIGRVEKKGFETKISLPTDAKAVQIGALEGDGGAVVRKSEIVYIG